MAQDSIGAGKIILGCGCVVAIIAIIAVLAIGALGVGGIFAAKQVAQEYEEDIEKAKQKATELAEAQKELERAATKHAKTMRSKTDDAKARAAFLRWATEPTSEEDLEKHQKFMLEWKDSKALAMLQEGKKSLESAGKKQGEGDMMDKLAQLDSIKNIALGAGPARDELDKMSTEYGGSEGVLERYYKILTLSAVAHGVAAEHREKDPASDAVAELMIKDHPDAAKRYLEWESAYRAHYSLAAEVLEAPIKAGEEDRKAKLEEAAKAFGESIQVANKTPGLLLLGKLPASSLGTWKEASPKERAELMKTLQETPFFGMHMIGGTGADFSMAARHIVALQGMQILSEAQESAAAPEGSPAAP